MEFLKKFRYSLAIALLMAIVVIIRIPYLGLPYFWDEAWPYGPAVRVMLDNGISLLPDAIDPELSRGHPLVFHALAATWMKFFGVSLTASHIFPLIISLTLIAFIYFFCKNLFSKEVGLIACIFLVIQPVFLAQASLLLPEMLVALLMIAAVYCYLKEYFFSYVIAATLLCLTKESGIVIFPAILAGMFIDHFKLKDDRIEKIGCRILIVILPAFIAAGFFILQKQTNGWYFFPLHTNGISINPEIFFNKLENYFSFLFIYQHRNLLSLSLIISCLLFYKLNATLYSRNRIIILLSIAIVCYLLFSSMVFFSPRYLLACLPPFVIIAAYFFFKNWKPYKLCYLIIASIVIHQINFSFKQENTDHNLSYINEIKVYQQMVQYCEKNNLFDKKIVANFLMRVSLTNIYSGYLSGKSFQAVNGEYGEATEYCIFSDMEYEKKYDELKATDKLKLVKRFQSKAAWTEIYQVMK